MPYQGVSYLLYLVILALGWIYKAQIAGFLWDHTPMVLGLIGGTTLLVLALPIIEWATRRGYRCAWQKRMMARQNFPFLPLQHAVHQGLQSASGRYLAPIFRTRWGQYAAGYWQDAGFGDHPLSLMLGITLSGGGGAVVGYLISGRMLLSMGLSGLCLVGLSVLIYSRAQTKRRLFSDQFPDVLDRLADSLQAGFSLPQALAFVVPNLPQPSSSEMKRTSDQIKLGYTVDQSLLALYERRPSEDVRLLVEGLTLQRQVGGNMAAMMRNMAEVVRKRVKLEHDVRSMTAQGRLSAVVISLLVPVSIALLSMFPGYVDVLFNTMIGNLVLLAAAVLELIGAAIVSRLIRIEV